MGEVNTNPLLSEDVNCKTVTLSISSSDILELSSCSSTSVSSQVSNTESAKVNVTSNRLEREREGEGKEGVDIIIVFYFRSSKLPAKKQTLLPSKTKVPSSKMSTSTGLSRLMNKQHTAHANNKIVKGSVTTRESATVGIKVPEGKSKLVRYTSAKVKPSVTKLSKEKPSGIPSFKATRKVLPQGNQKVEENQKVLPQGNQKVLPQGNQKVLPQGNQKVLPQGNQKVLPQGNQKVLPQGNQKVLAQGNQKVLPQGNQKVLLQKTVVKPSESKIAVKTATKKGTQLQQIHTAKPTTKQTVTESTINKKTDSDTKIKEVSECPTTPIVSSTPNRRHTICTPDVCVTPLAQDGGGTTYDKDEKKLKRRSLIPTPHGKVSITGTTPMEETSHSCLSLNVYF